MKTTLLLIATCISSLAFAEDLPRRLGYSVNSYWDFGGYFNQISSDEVTSVGTLRMTGYGPTFDVRHGVLIESSAFFEIFARTGVYTGFTGTTLNESLGIKPASGMVMPIEGGIGGGYILTYIPLRWYVQYVSRSFSRVFLPTTGLRLGISYYFNPRTAVSLEFMNGSANGQRTFTTASGSDIEQSITSTSTQLNLGISWQLPFSYPEEPWKQRYQDPVVENVVTEVPEDVLSENEVPEAAPLDTGGEDFLTE